MLLTAISLACGGATFAFDEAGDPVAIGSPSGGPSNDTKPGAALSPAPEERSSVAAGKSAKSARSLFRCWQGGRQVFEGRGYGALPPSQVAAELKGGEGATGRLQVLEMYDGFCVLELPR